jgi:hypothetical protein
VERKTKPMAPFLLAMGKHVACAAFGAGSALLVSLDNSMLFHSRSGGQLLSYGARSYLYCNWYIA